MYAVEMRQPIKGTEFDPIPKKVRKAGLQEAVVLGFGPNQTVPAAVPLITATSIVQDPTSVQDSQLRGFVEAALDAVVMGYTQAGTGVFVPNPKTWKDYDAKGKKNNTSHP